MAIDVARMHSNIAVLSGVTAVEHLAFEVQQDARLTANAKPSASEMPSPTAGTRQNANAHSARPIALARSKKKTIGALNATPIVRLAMRRTRKPALTARPRRPKISAAPTNAARPKIRSVQTARLASEPNGLQRKSAARATKRSPPALDSTFRPTGRK